MSYQRYGGVSNIRIITEGVRMIKQVGLGVVIGSGVVLLTLMIGLPVQCAILVAGSSIVAYLLRDKLLT